MKITQNIGTKNVFLSFGGRVGGGGGGGGERDFEVLQYLF